MAMWWTNPRSAFNSGFAFTHADCRSGRTPCTSDGSPEATSGQSASVGSDQSRMMSRPISEASLILSPRHRPPRRRSPVGVRAGLGSGSVDDPPRADRAVEDSAPDSPSKGPTARARSRRHRSRRA
jgi:hypothetical protein